MVVDPSLILEVVSDCYKIGKQIVILVQTWKSADEEVRSRVVTVESAWNKTQAQVDYLQRIERIIEATLYANFEDLLSELSRCLHSAMHKLQTIDKKVNSRKIGTLQLGFKGKAQYLWKKKALDEVITDLEAWMRRFDPSWFLLMKIADPLIDQKLQEARSSSNHHELAAEGPPDVLKDPLGAAAGLRSILAPNGSHHKSMGLPECAMEIVPIAHSEACFGRLTGDSKWYLVDSISTHNTADVSALKRNVRHLALRLSRADPIAFGLLSCKGVMAMTGKTAKGERRGDITSFQMVFRIPPGMNVLRSLRDLLLTFPDKLSVTQRVQIARELANAVSYVHAFGFVHKSIRPESILYFEDRPHNRSHTFLVGFESFRAADGATNYHGDDDWERNLYRHPGRQGVWAPNRYSMQHDIYSLGVCLLEVGLWQSFVVYNPEISNHIASPAPGAWYQDFQTWLDARKEQATPGTVKAYLTNLARERLPSRMGDRYTNVVLGCLTCLNEEEEVEDTGPSQSVKDEHFDMDIAVEFVEQTVTALTEILT